MRIQDEAMRLSRSEKLHLMEALWDDLTREGDLDSPGWHESALRETEARRNSGEEKVWDWDDAKDLLRGIS